jgi:hypothetical protein
MNNNLFIAFYNEEGIVTLRFKHELFELEMILGSISEIRISDWDKLIRGHYMMTLGMDNEYNISHNGGYLKFVIQTSESGQATYKIPFHQCENALTKLTNWFKSLPI